MSVIDLPAPPPALAALDAPAAALAAGLAPELHADRINAPTATAETNFNRVVLTSAPRLV
jgi:hypothetical protein